VHHGVNGVVKAGVGFQVADIADTASGEVVNDIDFLSEAKEVFSQVGADKARPTRDKNICHAVLAFTSQI